MLVLFLLGLVAGSLIVVPLLLVGLALRLAIGLALIPFRIVGLAIQIGLGFAVGLAGLMLAGTILLIPLLPVLALVAGIWLIVRLARRQPAAGLAAR